jgi:hypothetical protein
MARNHLNRVLQLEGKDAVLTLYVWEGIRLLFNRMAEFIEALLRERAEKKKLF